MAKMSNLAHFVYFFAIFDEIQRCDISTKFCRDHYSICFGLNFRRNQKIGSAHACSFLTVILDLNDHELFRRLENISTDKKGGTK